MSANQSAAIKKTEAITKGMDLEFRQEMKKVKVKKNPRIDAICQFEKKGIRRKLTQSPAAADPKDSRI